MTALQLYKFIDGKGIEWRWEQNEAKRDVIAFIPFYVLDEFVKLMPNSLLDEGGIECRMKNGYVALWMLEMAEYYGIELKEVFDKEDSGH